MTKEKSTFFSSRMVSVGGYYRVTFRIFYCIAMSLAIYSKVASTLTITISTILGIAALSKITVSLQRKKFSRHLLYTVLPLTMCLGGLYSFFRHGDYFLAIAESLCGIVPAFVYYHNRSRGYWLSVLTMIVLGLGDLLLEERVEAYVLFILMLLVAVFNLNAANLYFLARDKSELGEGLPPKYFYLLFRTLPAAVIVTAVIFTSFPRMRALAINFGNSKNGNQVGYTESISLSGGGLLNEASTVAFWVDSENKDWLAGEGQNTLFRGNSLEVFDGFTWVRESTPTVPVKTVIDLPLQKAQSNNAISLKFYREPSNSRAIFVPEILRSISMPSQLLDATTVDNNRNISHQRPEIGRFAYELTITPPTIRSLQSSPRIVEYFRPLDNSIDAGKQSVSTFASLDPTKKPLLIHIPKKLKDSDWFPKWVDSIGEAKPEDTIGTKLRSLTRIFRSEFKVSLENNFEGDSALQDFLTKKKEGHCEYFVSASVMYLRSQGIPARAVAGYRGGVYNVVTQLLEVQEKHAHAWVEFWWPDVGWVEFDPTPFQSVLTERNIVSDLKHYISAVNFWFYKYVVDFNAETQKDLAANLIAIDFKKLTNFGSFAIDESIKELSIIAASLIAMLWILFRVLKRRDDLTGLPRFYVRLANRVRTLGFTRNSGETFRAYHQRLVDSGLSTQVINEIDRALESSIYGEQKISNTQYRELIRQIKLLKKPKAGVRP